MSRTHLISFLGLGPYFEVQHQWRGEPGLPTPFAAVSLSRELDLGPDDPVVILATEQAWTDRGRDGTLHPHGERLLQAFDAAGCPPPRLGPHLAPGDQPDDYWQHFEVLTDTLRQAGPDDTVYLDITHSYRAHPLLAGAVVSYLRSIDEHPPDVRLVYAALEAAPRDDMRRVAGPVPVWDLTPFVELADWTWMLTLFLKTGRAGDAAATLARISQVAWRQARTEEERVAAGALKHLGRSMESFSNALVTVRTGRLLHGQKSEASRLAKAVRLARPGAKRAAKPLADVLDRVQAMADPLVTDDLAGPDGDRAVGELARLYLSLERHLEAMATVREGWLNRFASADAVRPGGKRRNSAGRERKPMGDWFESQPKVAGAVTSLRNDLLHAGYNLQGPGKGPRLVLNVCREVERFASSSGTTPSVSSTPSRPFLNLSNHPSAGWTDAQRNAALVLASPVVDLAFPAVDPNLDLAQVEALAHQVVVDLGPVDVAMVMGESVLVAALVQRLQAQGVRCVAATTQRQVTVDADGTKRSRFDFVAFRDYPGNP